MRGHIQKHIVPYVLILPSILFLIAIGAMWPIVLNTASGVAGLERQSAHAVPSLVGLVGIPDAAIPGAGRTIKIHHRQSNGFALWNLFSHIGRQIPAATQAVQYFIDSVA